MSTATFGSKPSTERIHESKTLPRLFNACLLRPQDFPASQDDVEVIGAFNPGVIATEEGIILLVRVAEQAREKRRGHMALPRWDFERHRVVVDWHRVNEVTPVDTRVVKHKESCCVRLNFTSHLRVVFSRDGKRIDSTDGATLRPENVYEEYGIEDPRITRIGEVYYITYVAVSRHGVVTALASTKDFKTFERHGIIFPPENKDVVLFPEKIGGEYYALHRPNAATPFTQPEMWLATSPDLTHWGHHEQFLGGSETWDIGRIGAGTPPIRTSEGWLEIYHGNSKRAEDAGIGTYAGGLLLLDLDNPRRIIGRSGGVFVPETEYECEGFVPNVVFPTGIVERDGTLLVYYGGADTFTGVVEFSMKDVLDAARRT
ncbi:MAG TPA: glycoside hydrolase family 130 protein [Candidatus Limnocylindria bacterium]|nr:glycoside hydrolase family 130 protein [Candidatus Limnocylindria bacterium]